MGSELKAIAAGLPPDSSGWRNQDYEAFTSTQLKECVESMDIHIIGYHKIRDMIRNNE